MKPGPTIAFRTDASIEIGTGHVMRCLTLADVLAGRGVACHFLSRELEGNLCDRIAARGHSVHRLAAPQGVAATDQNGPPHGSWLAVSWQEDVAESRSFLSTLRPDWLVLDHYALDAKWQSAVLPPECRLLVIDDLADRPHVADIVLDQNLGRKAEDYEGLVPSTCHRLIGPGYALLRPEFAAARERSLARRGAAQLRRIMVSMGGIDRDNATGAVLDALATTDLPNGVEVTVILGGNAPWLEAVRAKADASPFPCRFLVDRQDMAELLVETDLAIGAAGSSSWERCCLGVPTILLVLADNQVSIGQALAGEKAALLVGKVSDESAFAAIPAAVTSARGSLGIMSSNAAACCDGSGTSSVADRLASDLFSTRKAMPEDGESIWNWRYADGAERYYRSGRRVSLADHLQWFEHALQDETRQLYVVTRGSTKLGHVRIDRAVNDPRVGHVGICLAPEARGKGQAGAILSTALEAAFFSGVRRFIAEVHEDNKASVRLFIGLGFSVDGQVGPFVRYTRWLGATG